MNVLGKLCPTWLSDTIKGLSRGRLSVESYIFFHHSLKWYWYPTVPICKVVVKSCELFEGCINTNESKVYKWFIELLKGENLHYHLPLDQKPSKTVAKEVNNQPRTCHTGSPITLKTSGRWFSQWMGLSYHPNPPNPQQNPHHRRHDHHYQKHHPR